MRRLDRVLVYALLRLAWLARSPESACMVGWCARSRVGYSAWCRVHTDEILHGPKSPELIEALEKLGWEEAP